MGERWRRWRVHVALLAIGVVAGLVLTVWDLASPPTRCRGPMQCIDFTGAASMGYWLVFAVQALVSSVAMVFLVRSPRRFFRSHVTAAGTLLACISIGWVVLIVRPPQRAGLAPVFAVDPAAPQAR